MPWHTDEQLYSSPQWELIYVVENTSDSKTQWLDEEGDTQEEWTPPNSLLAVLVRVEGEGGEEGPMEGAWREDGITMCCRAAGSCWSHASHRTHCTVVILLPCLVILPCHPEVS